MKVIISFCLFNIILINKITTQNILAQDFGMGGKSVINIGWASDQLNALTIQDDEKIIAAGLSYVGTRYFVMVRYNDDGSIDNSFGVKGIVSTNIGPSNDYLNSIDIDRSTGKIISAGYAQKYDGTNDFFAIVRYLPNGTIDSTFGINGMVLKSIGTFGAQATSLKIKNDGKIIVGGSSSLGSTLLMLNENGKIDSTFGKEGIFSYLHRGTYTSVNSILIDNSNNILIAANYSSTAIIMRLLPSGTFDSTWNSTGRLELNISGARVEGLALASNNQIIVTGENYNSFKFFALELNENGSLNKNFGDNGIALLSMPSKSLYVGRNCGIQQNGNIVIAGFYAFGTANNNQIVIGRLTKYGSPDSTFSSNGIKEVKVEDNKGRATYILIDKKNRILIGGADEENHEQDDFLLVRLKSNGERDSTFRSTGAVVTAIGSSNDRLWGAYLQSNKRILLSGISENDAAIARLMPTGELDYDLSSDGITTFAICGVDFIGDIVESKDKKILVIGSKCAGSVIYRLLDSGEIDSTFGSYGVAENPLGTNSKIFILKNNGFQIINGNKVAQYLESGDLDSSYGAFGISTAIIADQFLTKYSIKLSDGSFITGGAIANGDVVLYKINSLGEWDNSFGTNGKMVFTFSPTTGQSLKGIALQNDGKIFITGYAGSKLYIIKLLSNGTKDINFGFDGLLYFQDCIGCRVNRIGILSNDKILLAGTHDSKFFFLYVLNPDGSIDKNFGPDGKVEIGFNNQLCELTEVLREENDQLFIAGTVGQDFVVVKVILSLVVGVINKSINEKYLNIYPNPLSNTLLSIEYELSNDQIVTLNLYNPHGQLSKVFVKAEKRNKGKYLEHFEIPQTLPNGHYILEIKTENGIISKILIIINH